METFCSGVLQLGYWNDIDDGWQKGDGASEGQGARTLAIVSLHSDC